MITDARRAGPAANRSSRDPASLGLSVRAALVRASVDGIVFWDVDRRYVYANPAACELLGYPLDRLVGRDFLTDVPEWNRPSALAYFDKARSGKIARGPFVVHRPGGSELYVEATTTIVKFRRKQFIAVVFRDVSERLTQERKAAALAQATASVAMGDSVEATVRSLAECGVRGTRALGVLVTFGNEDDRAIWIGTAGLPDSFREAIRPCPAAWAHAFIGCQEAPTAPRVVLYAQRVVVYADARRKLESCPKASRLSDPLRSLPWQAAVCADLIYRGAIVGLLSAIYPDGELPSEADTTFLGTLADQAAIAAANAQLMAIAQEKVALEERQRLARELHDSLSQAFFGIQLGARQARELVERGSAGVAQRIDYVAQLAEVGQAEMRALILELRPELLDAEGLVAALNKQVEALRARHSIAARTIAQGEPASSFEVKQALYRIAQEALQNTVKHARASRVDVQLEASDGTVVLAIEDDGVGFDPEGQFPGHLGLRSMRERALGVRGSLEVVSSRGQGTRIVVRVPLSSEVHAA
jgi:PAS domain S-box-containing protein